MKEEQQQWELLQKGQQAALAHIFKTHYGALFQYGLHLTGREQLTKDQIQQLFLKLWERRAKLPAVKSVKAYLLQSLRNIIFDDARLRQRATGLKSELINEPASSAEQQLIAKEQSLLRQQQLKAALNKLSDRQREIIHLRFYQAIPYPQIAEMLGMEYQSVRNTVYRAIKVLRKALN